MKHRHVLYWLARAAGVLALAFAAGTASASVVYSYQVINSSYGFTYSAPALYPGAVSAADLDRCDFGIGITCTGVAIYDNYFRVYATDASAVDPALVLALIDVGGCPPYFGIGYSISISACSSANSSRNPDLVHATFSVSDGQTVPEPGSLWLVGASLTGLALARRRGPSGALPVQS